jgi:hypothetical protein
MRAADRIRRLFSSEYGAADRLIPRWIVLRALGLLYFSAFFSLLFQIRGLIGPRGILPAELYLNAVASSLGPFEQIWFAPTLLWLSSGNHMLMALCWVGMTAALLAFFNFWPRLTLLICLVCFLSFVSAAQDFSGYQSDGMLLEMGFLALFFAPPGVRPGWGRAHPPSRASLFLLQWEWFRIYFESGLVKLLSGDPQWRHMTAMDQYYQNGPLPTWIGWYVQHFPHWFQASTALATLVMELGIVWMIVLPRRWRIVCFLIVTPWEAAVILTANYAFLNYLVLTLGFLLLDDRLLTQWIPFLRRRFVSEEVLAPAREPASSTLAEGAAFSSTAPASDGPRKKRIRIWPAGRRAMAAAGLGMNILLLTWVFYATTAELVHLCFRNAPVPMEPVAALEPFRVANQYGLFAVMTRNRYEIEFQGSRDGDTWTAYPYRYKPQALNAAPGIYAPYQPRFEWNLWFASLGNWQQNPMVPRTEIRLLSNDPDVLELFAGNPFPGTPPTQVRAVLWQYRFTTKQEKRATGNWWRRAYLGLYAPALGRGPTGQLVIVAAPQHLPNHD